VSLKFHWESVNIIVEKVRCGPDGLNVKESCNCANFVLKYLSTW